MKFLPFALMSVLYFLLWLQFAGDNARFFEKIAKLQISLASYTATVLHLIGWYLRNLFIPMDIVFIKNMDPVQYQLWGWNLLFFAIAASIGFLFYRTGRSFLGFALAWFLTGFLLAVPAVFTHASMGMVIEPNWFYFASQGFFMLIAWPLGRLRKNGQGLLTALFVVIAAYWVTAAQFQHSVNRSELKYADHWLQKSPHNRQAILILGTLYINDPGYEIRPEFVPDMLWLTEFHAGYGHNEAASRLMARLTDGKVPASWDNGRLIRLAAVYYKIGDIESSEEVSAYLIVQNPGSGIFLQLGAGFDRQGLTEPALQFIKENIRHDPASSEPYYLYGIILANQDRWDEAITWLEKGRALAPADQRFSEIIRQIKHLKEKSGPAR